MTQNKLWAILNVSRKKYVAARSWKAAGMSRERFEEVPAPGRDAPGRERRIQALRQAATSP